MNKHFLILALIATACLYPPTCAREDDPVFKERLEEKQKAKEDHAREQRFEAQEDTSLKYLDRIATTLLLFTVGSEYAERSGNNGYSMYNASYIKSHGPDRKYNPLIIATAGLVKVAATIRRMQLNNRYVGWNPFKFIPSFAYFSTIDMLSWVTDIGSLLFRASVSKSI